jgi:excisionase family DNA binding protein
MPSHVLDQAVIRQSLGRRLEMGDLPELVNLAQTAQVLGLSKPQVRRLIQSRRLEHVLVGQRPFVPKTAIPRFIADNTVQPCREETPALASAFSESERAFTSAGPKQAAAGSAARTRQIANRLKSRSPSSCASAPAGAAPVIPLKSS